MSIIEYNGPSLSQNSKKIKNTTGIVKFILVVNVLGVVVAKGRGIHTTINTPTSNTIFICDTEAEVTTLIAKNNYVEVDT